MTIIRHALAIDVLRGLETASVDMIYTDPPFGTQKMQTLKRLKGTSVTSIVGYSDHHDDYLEFMREHVEEMHRCLKPTGTMYLHLDWHHVHYVKVMCDDVFEQKNFMNEIIYSYDYGSRGKNRWPRKHDNILVYAKKFGQHTFNWDDIDRLPYVTHPIRKGQKRDSRGKVPTDVWPLGIIGTASKERTKYPNQKPIRLIQRAIIASSNSGDLIVDPFCGSGTTGCAALNTGRKFVIADSSEDAISVMRDRFNKNSNVVFYDK